jgi:hypothetical protein
VRVWRIAHRFSILVYVLAVWHTFIYGTSGLVLVVGFGARVDSTFLELVARQCRCGARWNRSPAPLRDERLGHTIGHPAERDT